MQRRLTGKQTHVGSSESANEAAQEPLPSIRGAVRKQVLAERPSKGNRVACQVEEVDHVGMYPVVEVGHSGIPFEQDSIAFGLHQVADNFQLLQADMELRAKK